MKIIRYILLIIVAFFSLSLIIDLLSIFSVHSYFFGFFQSHFGFNIWLIRIITLIFLYSLIYFVWPNVKEVLNPTKYLSSESKRLPALAVVGFLIFLYFLTYLSDKDKRFDAEGKSLICIAWAIDHYEEVPCKCTEVF